MKKIVRLTEGELTNLIKRVLKEDSESALGMDTSLNGNNCYKVYRNPESKTDPYIYRMGPECIWQTKSDNVSDYLNEQSKIIKDWISLYGNEKANRILDKWFPNAKSDCSKCKKKTPISTDCPKYIDCFGTPSPCKTPKMMACIKSGKTHVRTYQGGDNVSDCPKTLNCMPVMNGTTPKLCKNLVALEMCKKQGMKVTY